MRRVAALLRAPYLRYVGVSAGALAVDISVYLGALHVGVAAVAAAAIGYLVGVSFHWILSSRLVFDDVAQHGLARTRQKALFLTSALVGLGLTIVIVALATRFGVDPRLAKLGAIAVSFQATYMLRRRIVFA
ncbi:MAG: GtrA family protein [Sphingomonadaceae bacterium]